MFRRKHNLIAQRLLPFRNPTNRNSQLGNHVYGSISFKLITAAYGARRSHARFQLSSTRTRSDRDTAVRSLQSLLSSTSFPVSVLVRVVLLLARLIPRTLRSPLPSKRDRSLVGCVLICFVSYRFFFFVFRMHFCSSQRGRLQQMPLLFHTTTIADKAIKIDNSVMTLYRFFPCSWIFSTHSLSHSFTNSCMFSPPGSPILILMSPK